MRPTVLVLLWIGFLFVGCLNYWLGILVSLVLLIAVVIMFIQGPPDQNTRPGGDGEDE